MAKDPLGVQPPRVSGQRKPLIAGPVEARRIGEIQNLLQTIWVDYPPQLENIYHLMSYRFSTLGRWGHPFDGAWLREETQAGKSALGWRLKALLLDAATAEGKQPNDYQVLIVTIKKGMTIKGFLQAVLQQMGDEFSRHQKGCDRRSIEELEARVAEWAKKLNVELLIVEEVQRLETGRIDAKQITEQFQTMLDRGVVPLVLVGTRASEDMMRQNPELCARLGTPLDLLPISTEDDDAVAMFQDFCEGFDKELVRLQIFKSLSNLDEPEICEPLSVASGGYVGRTARIIKEAAIAAARRGADWIEAYDLSNATRLYAIPNGWIDYDPFSR
jgi:hypothetical protein